MGVAGAEPRKRTGVKPGGCRSGSSRGTSVGPPHRCGFALA